MENYGFPNITLENTGKFYRLESNLKHNEQCVMKFKIFQDTEDFILTMKLSRWEKEVRFDYGGCTKQALNETNTMMIRYFNELERLSDKGILYV